MAFLLEGIKKWFGSGPSDASEPSTVDSEDGWIQGTNLKDVKKQNEMHEKVKEEFKEKRKSKKQEQNNRGTHVPDAHGRKMPGKRRRSRRRCTSCSQFSTFEQDDMSESESQSRSRRGSLQNALNQGRPWSSLFTNSQSCTDIPSQINHGDLNSESDIDDDTESFVSSQAGSEAELTSRTESESDESIFYTRNDPFEVPSEENQRSRYDESCDLYSKQEEDGTLQQDMMKYGLDLPENIETSISRKNKNRKFYDEFLPQEQLHGILRSNPQKYKRCKICIESAHAAVCKNLDAKDELKEIEISGRSKAGKVFNGDIVLVEIYNYEKFQTNFIRRLKRDINKNNRTSKVYGKVVGLFESNPTTDIEHPVFVCTLDNTANYLMRPICKTIPKLTIINDHGKKHVIKVHRYDARSSNIEFDHDFPIDPGKKKSYVFLVVYLSWQWQYPDGAVIEVIKIEDDFTSAMKILRLSHNVPEYYQKETTENTRTLLENIETNKYTSETSRVDFSETLRVFTIDPEDSRDLDDALSVEQVGKNFRVGVHIADVSVVLRKDDPIDMEAQERATTFYPGQGMNPYHMLPEPFASNICSLIPHVKRPTLSVIFTVDKDGMFVQETKPLIKKSVIKSCRQFSYTEVQKIIDDNNYENDIEKDVITLFQIAKAMRWKRLRAGICSYPVETKLNSDKDSILYSREAHYLVEEFMILANATVAKFLSSCPSFRKLLPLRCQSAPSRELIESWLKENSPMLHMVLQLQEKIPDIRNTQSKIGLEQIGPLRYTRLMPVQKWVWENIDDFIKQGDLDSAIKMICSDELHPSQCLALEEWISFQETALYRCSGTLDSPEEGIHFSLQTQPYVHFTSPIRRYPDIMVHRLLHAALDRQKPPYSVDDVDKLCQGLNEVIKRAKQFQKQCKMLVWGFKLRHSPQILQGFVQEISDKSVTLVLPGLRSLPSFCKEIELNLLHVSKRPIFKKDIDTDGDIMTLYWSQRLYDLTGRPAREDRRAYMLTKEAKEAFCKRINPHMKTKFVQQEIWKNILKMVINNDSASIEGLQRNRYRSDNKFGLDEDLHNHIPACKDTVLDHSSEVDDPVVIRTACEYSMSFSRCQVICVQITAEPQKGILLPSLQLFDMTKSIKHCLQHNRDPIKFLAKYSEYKTKPKYFSSTQYLQLWLPIMEMEAVTTAVDGDSSTISNVHVTMDSLRTGYFYLPAGFCEQRDIDFHSMTPEFILLGKDDEDHPKREITEFVCIRTEINTSLNVDDRSAMSVDPNNRVQWIMHGQLTEVEKIIKPNPKAEKESETETKKSDGILTKFKVKFKLHRESNNPISEMLQSDKPPTSCIELIQKTETDGRTEEVLKCIGESSKLAKAIALNRPIQHLDAEHFKMANDIDIEVDLPGISLNNVFQAAAIRHSLRSRFSLIHGPPGTGKTYTGIKLVYHFDKINDILETEGLGRKQVVFCGPNNKSVDLVAKWILAKFQALTPDIVRLYGNSLENKDYPMPGKHYTKRASARDYKPDRALKHISVHQLIREDGKIHADEIRQFDRRFEEFSKGVNGYTPNIKEIKRYKKITSEAAQEELMKHSVIFCTTAVTTSPRFIKATTGKIQQLIIDEAGMCTEPESLAAIIATKAEQVVLIGDHKQLCPVITSTHAADLGLEKSLFERYSQRAKMLQYQYRMHPGICKFPSVEFYNDKLITKSSLAWDIKHPLDIWINREKIPIVFCHVEGEEDYLTVSTEEGNEQSCSNKQEVEQVIRVFEHLVEIEGVNPSNKVNINIMSQYNAQCHQIRQALLKKKYININVNTVVASQGGEWNYVIFSTVRSLPEYRIEKYPSLGWCKRNLGFITDQHQINVALTRARRGLIIIGNKNLLSCDRVWARLIKHYARLGCLTEAKDFPRPATGKKRRKKRSGGEDRGSEQDFYRGTDREDEVEGERLLRIEEQVYSRQLSLVEEEAERPEMNKNQG